MTVRMWAVPKARSTVWEFTSELRGGLARMPLRGPLDAVLLAAKVCERFADFAPPEPSYFVRRDGEYWLVTIGGVQ